LAHTQADWARPETISAEAAGTRRKRKRWNTCSVPARLCADLDCTT